MNTHQGLIFWAQLTNCCHAEIHWCQQSFGNLEESLEQKWIKRLKPPTCEMFSLVLPTTRSGRRRENSRMSIVMPGLETPLSLHFKFWIDSDTQGSASECVIKCTSNVIRVARRKWNHILLAPTGALDVAILHFRSATKLTCSCYWNYWNYWKCFSWIKVSPDTSKKR